jgi:Ser/Thr protein kinase RdoA (MazF antagonist)
LTTEGADHCRTSDGAFWRALRFIGPSHTVDAIQDPALAREVGHALGTFHSLLSDLPADELADTLPGFHVAPIYLARYDEVTASPFLSLTVEEAWCAQFVAKNRDWVPILEDAREQGLLRLRPIHGDPKVNNILFDSATGRAIAVVDLDTVKPGLVQYDIGDCLRSSCNPHGEETPHWQDVHFDLELAKAVLEGYLAIARDFFEDADFDYVPESVRLIAFELGLRFFTDHLAGDTYFKVAHHGQNLARALVQFKLAESVHGRLEELRAIVEGLR